MIFYFSATGNSKWAAEKLAGLISDKACDISKLDKAPEYSLKAGERLGFVFPVHGWRVPSIVREFISALNINHYTQFTYTYALCTAGDSIGETMTFLRKELGNKGLHLNATFSVIMPESYIGLPFMYLDTYTSANTKYYNASVRLNKYATIISEGRGGEHLDKGTFPKFYSYCLGSFFEKYLITDAFFHVDKEKCIGCGLCSKSCPVNDIRQGESREPVWKRNKKCLTCFACLHHCPTNAISWGWFTNGKGQYYYGKKKVKECL